MTPRPYQVEARASVASALIDTGLRRQLIALPTGTGKTVLFACLLQDPRLRAWVEALPPRARKVMVIAHREELLDQAARTYRSMWPSLYVDIEQADRRASVHANVVVASVATLTAGGGRRLRRFSPDDFRVVIVDEAHHAAASSYLQVLAWFRFIELPRELADDAGAEDEADTVGALLAHRSDLAAFDKSHEADDPRLLVGVTATPRRGDAIGLECVFQTIAYSKSIREMIDAGWLAPLRALRISTGTSLAGVKTRRGDYDERALAKAVNVEERNRLVISAWRKHASDRKTVAFTVDIAHAHTLADLFRQAGVAAEPVDGTMHRDQRRAALARFKSGQTQLLTNCNVLTEGFDEPGVSCIVHARPTKSALLYTQMTGRGTRLAPGKVDCLVLDFVDLARKHSLVTAPTLLGLPPNFDAKGGDLSTAAKRFDDVQEKYAALDLAPVLDRETFTIDDVTHAAEAVDLWAVPPMPAEAQAATTMEWLSTPAAGKAGDGGRYRLSWQLSPEAPKEALTVEPNLLGNWAVTRVEMPRGGAPLSQVVAAAPNETEALRMAEAWVLRERPQVARLKRRGATWRADPATQGQLGALRAMRIPHDAAVLTKGQASQLLDMHAARRASKP